MAKFGAKYPAYAPFATENAAALPTYGVGGALGKLIAANLTISTATGELYADDAIAEKVTRFTSGTLVMETDDMTDAIASVIYGATLTGNTLINNTSDEAPFVGIGYYEELKRAGVIYFRATYLPKARAEITGSNAQTRGSSITFNTTSTTFTVYEPNTGDWRYMETFSDEASALAWVKSKLGIATAYEVKVATSGAGSATPAHRMVPAGEDLDITITGTVEAIYDNGLDVNASVQAGVYTIEDIDANHDIVIAF